MAEMALTVAGEGTDPEFWDFNPSGPVRFELRIAVDIGVPIGSAPEFGADGLPDSGTFIDLVNAALEQLRRISDFQFDEAFGFHLWPRSFAGLGEPGLVEEERLRARGWDPDVGLLIRGSIGEAGLESVIQAVLFPGVYSDLPVGLASSQTPSPDEVKVRANTRANHWHQRRRWGRDVALAIVDSGLDTGTLTKYWGGPVSVDLSNSWAPRGLTAGSITSRHGNMCAYDALVCAPEATLVDIAAITNPMNSRLYELLSDAFIGLLHLTPIAFSLSRPLNSPGRPYGALVISNSWTAMQKSGDKPPGHLANYSHNSLHFVCLLVRWLANSGADVLFAAGNDPNRPIGGANSLDCVLTVTSIDLGEAYVSASLGPGLIRPDPKEQKPDLACYCQFQGPTFSANGHTSAACATAAGAIALYRSARPRNFLLSPAAVRAAFKKAAFKPTGLVPDKVGSGHLRIPIR